MGPRDRRPRARHLRRAIHPKKRPPYGVPIAEYVSGSPDNDGDMGAGPKGGSSSGVVLMAPYLLLYTLSIVSSMGERLFKRLDDFVRDEVEWSLP